MGTIVERRRKDGTVAYMAQIAMRREGRTHRETQSFDRAAAARAWIKKREGELSKPGGIVAAQNAGRQKTLGDAIDLYISNSKKAMGRTKTQVLRALKADDIAEIPCVDLGTQDLVDLARRLRETRGAATVANYLSHLSPIFGIAKPAWGIPLDDRVLAEAFKVTKTLGLTGKSKQRDRRPTLAELDRVLAYFEAGRRKRPRMMPMAAICAFALFSTRREEEISTILWADLDEAGSRVLVRDMKDPNEKEGNNIWCELPAEALRLALAQPRTSDRIFPYNHRSVSANMTRACTFLEIDNLVFHDLRHEGISRLFEMGRTIPQAASVSGHRSWGSLQRYTHLRQSGDKYVGWPWLDRLAPAANNGVSDEPDHPAS